MIMITIITHGLIQELTVKDLYGCCLLVRWAWRLRVFKGFVEIKFLDNDSTKLYHIYIYIYINVYIYREREREID